MMSSVPLNECRDQTTRIQADYWTIRSWLTNSQRWAGFITIRINEQTCSVAQLKNSNVVSGMLGNNTTRCLACYSFLSSATSLTTCSMAGTNRMTSCSDPDVKLANAPFRHFPCPASNKLMRDLEQWLVGVMLVVLPVSRPRTGKNLRPCDYFIWHCDRCDKTKISRSLIRARRAENLQTKQHKQNQAGLCTKYLFALHALWSLYSLF